MKKCLPNFLTQRDYPRVAYYSSDKTNKEDLKYFSSKTSNHVIVIGNKWFKIIKNTTLYLYEFNFNNFYIQDEIAGYYVSENMEILFNKIIIEDLFLELLKRNIEIRIVDNLWDLCDEIKEITLNWSMCRMAYAPKE